MKISRRFSCLAALLILSAMPALAAGARQQSQVPAPARREIFDFESGEPITAQDVKVLEDGLAKNPDNLAARSKLIEYYFQAGLESHSPDIEEKRQSQIFWVIEHHPEAKISGSPEAAIMPIGGRGGVEAYHHGKELWMQQVEKHPSDVQVILHAAEFLQFFDKEQESDLLQKALEIAPTDVEVLSKEAEFYELERIGVKSPEKTKELSEKALAFRERALQSAGADERSTEIEAIAVDALEAGDLARAEQSANELLKAAQEDKNGWNYGNAIHKGNIVLGRVALRRGDIEGAKQHLLAAGDISGSPQLDSFDPNMTLAKELLEKGERETVLAFLQSCAKFSETDRAKLQNWIATIKGGGTPDFESNLDY